MKKGKALRNVVLVGLSAVLVGGVAMAAAGCGGKAKSSANDPKITVSMFSSSIDKSTNQMIADNWVKKYNAAHNTNYTVNIENQTDKAEYYNSLSDKFKDNSIGDIIYIAPRNVKTFAMAGRVIDLTPYINDYKISDTEKASDNVQDLWANSIAYYGYEKSKPAFSGNTYTMGQPISYKTDGASGAGFYTDANEKVEIYGLPKDYSNFSMGFNNRFFSDELKNAYTTTMVNATRNVYAPKGNTGSPSVGKYSGDNANRKSGTVNSKDLIYTAASGTGVITYAVTGDYQNPYATDNANKTLHAQEGQPARIINVGVPVNIKPYNFYMYKSFQDAQNAGDPMAVMATVLTGGKGYTVTIPGFPDDLFTMPDTIGSGSSTMTVTKEGVSYDGSMGHIVYTYAEYGALLWSLTYYLNTFAWDKSVYSGNTDEGGVVDSTKEYRTVYGGEQYEGGAQDGAQLYLLPWLFSNDADLINTVSTFCTSYIDSGNMSAEAAQAARTALQDYANITLSDRNDWVNHAGTATETVKKLRLDGEYEDVAVQYGLNSQNFIETYAAFLAIGSDWNGNPGDTTDESTEGSGWDYFREGRGIFYGAGSWDPATRNEENWASMDFGQMATPVAEKYALYSNIKGANYEMVTYSNGAGKSVTGTPGKQVTGDVSSSNYKNSDFNSDLTIYSKADIEKNLACRQDKWGARMDSVGYAVTCKSTDTGEAGGTPTAKTEAAAALCIELTASKEAQQLLTYGGAQLPNFVSQCEDLLHYNDSDYDNYANGAFKDMITPEGDSEGNKVWEQYYTIAKELGDAAFNNQGGTVEQFLAGKTVNGQPVKYDERFKNFNVTQADFAAATTTATSRYSFAMKVLRMVAYRASDFDILIRMQTGLNSVRDSSMYTYDDTWLNPHDARSLPNQMLAYYRSRPLADKAVKTAVKWNPADSTTATTLLTPYKFCMQQAKQAQTNLETARNAEVQDLMSAGVIA